MKKSRTARPARALNSAALSAATGGGAFSWVKDAWTQATSGVDKSSNDTNNAIAGKISG